MSSSYVRAVTPDRRLAVFLLIAFGTPWLLWLLRESTGIDVVALAGMVAVGIAVLVATWPLRRDVLAATGVVPVRPLRTTLRECGLAVGLLLVLAVLSILIGAAVGSSPLDLSGLSALREVFGMPDAPAAGLLARAVGQALLLFVVMLPFFFCEEWGWRGYLLPRLLPLGVGAALPLSGLIWGLWHLPGYVGSGRGAGLVPFLIFAVVLGILLGWLRMRTRSIWPVTVAHAANNAIVNGFVNVAFLDADAIDRIDPWTFGLSGWPGWLVTGILLVALVLLRRFPLRVEREIEVR